MASPDSKPHAQFLDSTIRHESASPARAQERAAWLTVIACPEMQKVGSRWALSTQAPLLLGRGIEQGGVRFDDRLMSRSHARVVWDGRTSCFRVGDLNSENGTFVNAGRVQVASLEHGSVLRTGNTVCVLATHDPLAELEARVSRVAVADACVLVLGESGAGKERVARQLHEQSGRTGAFVAVNTAALPRELIASELFGHARGAFSGANSDRPGLFRVAHGGTLFLDEIGDFPVDLQPALLRVLEERRLRPVGSERELPVDVRVVAATHQALRARVQSGAFRLDLHARLAELELTVPALRERRHTLPALIDSLAAAQGLPRLTVSADAMELLALYAFPQNVRELRSLIGRVRVFGSPPFELDLDFLEREAPNLLSARSSEPSALDPITDPGVSRDELVSAMAEHGGRVALVAKAFGTSRTNVYRWLKRHGLAPRTQPVR